jgi:hypothetical protein
VEAVQLLTSLPSIMSCTIKTRRFISRDVGLRSLRSLDVSHFILAVIDGGRAYPRCEEQVDQQLG